MSWNVCGFLLGFGLVGDVISGGDGEECTCGCPLGPVLETGAGLEDSRVCGCGTEDCGRDPGSVRLYLVR
jgi:hypothetical protein